MADAVNGKSHNPDGLPISEIPKSWHFTSSLPPDSLFPTPAASHKTPRKNIGPRTVRDAIFTWVRPEAAANPELLAVSPAAMRAREAAARTAVASWGLTSALPFPPKRGKC